MIYDVVVLGAGQAGLSMGYYLKNSSLSFLIIDNSERIGDVWRKRYDSLTLFTPSSYSSLHGLAMEGNPIEFPTKDEIADYLERYANNFNLPLLLNTEVKKIHKEDTIFKITTECDILEAKNVVIATGSFQYPRIPSLSEDISEEVVQLHSSQYKNPSQLKEGSVIVVGGGNSGSQIASEISQSHETYLSVGQNLRFLPLNLANKSIFWWFDKIGILKASSSSFIGRRIQNLGDPIFGYDLKDKVKNGTVQIKNRTVSVKGHTITFEDQTSLDVHNIIWATGFIPDYSWIDIPSLYEEKGKLQHNRGITNIDGLYFLGLPWQHRRGSALLLGVGNDAKYLYQFIMSKN
ncbi:flavin-containing monooxygenase [Psychrobacillus vulpis]|uniref:Oxidoreductase n=1 Tax=Psychrobacillus vulpis TaxID=2325572 RepID=A0A544TSF5_9BACI|nr:NAD(P)/FAD-dependent oxidoreductase [Psychrobacillus vulpis]TQR20340.1 oxidoreductase [Psychrobacillus vulpis]